MCACSNHTSNSESEALHLWPLASARPTSGRSHLVAAAQLSAQLPAPQQPLLLLGRAGLSTAAWLGLARLG